jgi:cell division protein FtsW (lipid II flippase)
MGRFNWLWSLDWLLIAAACGLAAIGVAAIDAATDPRPGPGPVERQLIWCGIGLVSMFLVACTSCRTVENFSYISFALCVPLLVLVFWTEPVNGAQRWLRLGPVGLQPSEVAKLAYVAAVARFLSRREDIGRAWVVSVPLVLAAIPMLLILRQPDLGTSLLFIPVLGAMLFGAGMRGRHWAVLVVVGLIALPVLWKGMSAIQRARITGFLSQRDTGPRPRGDGYQLYQSKLMIALGSTSGSEQAAALHLPFDHTDFIFAVVGGHWGLAGVSATIVLFAILLWRGLRIAVRGQNQFGRLLAIGIVTLLATQGLVNMTMTVGLAPITGLTLPFVSYGGSSLLACFVALGILVNIARQPADELLAAR